MHVEDGTIYGTGDTYMVSTYEQLSYAVYVRFVNKVWRGHAEDYNHSNYSNLSAAGKKKLKIRGLTVEYFVCVTCTLLKISYTNHVQGLSKQE